MKILIAFVLGVFMKKSIKYASREFMMFAVILFIIFIAAIVWKNFFCNREIAKLSKQSEEEFRAMKLTEKQIEWFQDNKIKQTNKKWLLEYQTVIKDMKVFPLKKDTENEIGWSYENSWKEERTYGGKRFHEGTDIMADNNKRGYFSVLSVSDGIVEQKGWLEKGGWRIGIRSPHGAYYYYAHLCAYAEGIEVGNEVHAGDMIGTMGDSGYSKVEGTVGNFCVHLHFGIYLKIDEKEKSVNPYWILKELEE